MISCWVPFSIKFDEASRQHVAVQLLPLHCSEQPATSNPTMGSIVSLAWFIYDTELIVPIRRVANDNIVISKAAQHRLIDALLFNYPRSGSGQSYAIAECELPLLSAKRSLGRGKFRCFQGQQAAISGSYLVYSGTVL